MSSMLFLLWGVLSSQKKVIPGEWCTFLSFFGARLLCVGSQVASI